MKCIDNLKNLDTHEARIMHWETCGIGLEDAEYMFAKESNTDDSFKTSLALFIQDRWSLKQFCKLSKYAQIALLETLEPENSKLIYDPNSFEGLFKIGTILRHNNNQGILGEVVDKTRIKINSKHFTSFSAAANEVAKTHCNGWLYWEYKRPDGTWELVNVKRKAMQRQYANLLSDLL